MFQYAPPPVQSPSLEEVRACTAMVTVIEINKGNLDLYAIWNRVVPACNVSAEFTQDAKATEVVTWLRNR